MRKLIFLLFCGISFSTFSQNSLPCQVDLNARFGSTADKTPVVLNRLGTKPQFGEIAPHTREAAYRHLNSIYSRNFRGAKKELDNLFRMLGYKGFKDPNFTIDKISAEIIPAGRTGNMGRYSKGFKYTWATLGRDFEGFKVKANNSECFVYIMKKCGNVFYVPTDITPECAPCPPCTAVAYKPANPNCPTCPPCPPVCLEQQISVNAKGEIASGDVSISKENVTVLAKYNGQTINLGTYPMTVRSTYDFKVSADGSASKLVKVCRVAQTSVAPMNMTLPVNLAFSLAKQGVKLGENGTITVNLDQKQFGVLSSAFGKGTVSTTATSETAETFTKKETKMPASTSTGMTSGEMCTTQTLSFKGGSQISDYATKTSTQSVMVIGMYRKTGKLVNGESADKYLALGCFGVPVTQTLQFNVNAKADASTQLDICENSLSGGNVLDLPLNVRYNITNQDVAVGDGGRIIVPLTEAQYNKLSKSFSRCCSNGGKGCD